MRFKPRKAILTWCNARAPKLPGMETSVPGSGTPGGGLAENEVIHHDHFSGITVITPVPNAVLPVVIRTRPILSPASKETPGNEKCDGFYSLRILEAVSPVPQPDTPGRCQTPFLPNFSTRCEYAARCARMMLDRRNSAWSAMYSRSSGFFSAMAA